MISEFVREAKAEGATKEQAKSLLASILYAKRDLNTSMEEVGKVIGEVYGEA